MSATECVCVCVLVCLLKIDRKDKKTEITYSTIGCTQFCLDEKWSVLPGNSPCANACTHTRTFRSSECVCDATEIQTETYSDEQPSAYVRPRSPKPFSRLRCGTYGQMRSSTLNSEDCFMDRNSDGRELRCVPTPTMTTTTRTRFRGCAVSAATAAAAAHSVRFDAVKVEPYIMQH